MTGTHTEAILNKLGEPELFQLLVNADSNMGAHIAMLTAEIKEIKNHLKTRADVALTKNVNFRLVDLFVKTEK